MQAAVGILEGATAGIWTRTKAESHSQVAVSLTHLRGEGQMQALSPGPME
jgi:hypothetical protein